MYYREGPVKIKPFKHLEEMSFHDRGASLGLGKNADSAKMNSQASPNAKIAKIPQPVIIMRKSGVWVTFYASLTQLAADGLMVCHPTHTYILHSRVGEHDASFASLAESLV